MGRRLGHTSHTPDTSGVVVSAAVDRPSMRVRLPALPEGQGDCASIARRRPHGRRLRPCATPTEPHEASADRREARRVRYSGCPGPRRCRAARPPPARSQASRRSRGSHLPSAPHTDRVLACLVAGLSRQYHPRTTRMRVARCRFADVHSDRQRRARSMGMRDLQVRSLIRMSHGWPGRTRLLASSPAGSLPCPGS
jgi:hypothetical protein